MNEDFVTFNLAKKLKEKGFNKCVCGYYWETGGLSICNTPMNSNALKNEFSAPTISQVLKWLREEKKIHIVIDVCNGNWEYSIKEKIRLDESLQYISQTIPVPICRGSSYEEAAIAGIEYCLDNLI